MTQPSFDLSASLLGADAVRLSPGAPFTWASGLKSPIYCDNRQLLGFPQVRATVADALTDSIRALKIQPTLIAGTSTAGIPWATMVAGQLGLPLAYVRPEPKKHGMGRQVEGPLVAKHCVVLIEDLISTGSSGLKCVEALRNEGAEVIELLALFSYELVKAETSLKSNNVPWRALATLFGLLETAVQTGAIDHSGRQTLEAWRKDPQAWSDACS